MPAAATLKAAVPPAPTTWSAGEVIIVGGTLPDHKSALAMRRAPSVLATQKSLRASLEGGKKFNPATRPCMTLVAPANGWPLLQCATRLAPVAMSIGLFWKLNIPPSNEETPSRIGCSGRSVARAKSPGDAVLPVVKGR